MPNPIKYSTGSETLALKKGNFYIGTGDVGKGPTSSTGYYNGITPPSGGYTIYLNKTSGGPSIYTCANDTELVNLTNSIAETSYTTVNECLVYYASQTDKVVLNRDYEGIVTDGLILNLDAGFTPSYPRSGTNFYNLGGVNNGTLTNGPTFNSGNGGSIVFDGSDDIILVNDFNYTNSRNFTFMSFIKSNGVLSNARRGIFTKTGGGGYISLFGFNSGELYFENRDSINNTYSGIQGPPMNIFNGEWHFVGFTISTGSLSIFYDNQGTLSFQSITDNRPGGFTFTGVGIGRDSSSFDWNGNISISMFYDKTLSQSEILQNYNAQKGRFGL